MTTLDLANAKQDRSAYRTLGNGKAEWAWRIGGALISILLAYGTVQREQAQLEERERNHYTELRAAISDLRSDIRDLRQELRERRP